MHAYKYTYKHTYTYIYTCPHTYTHTHIYTHTYKMHARKDACNNGTAATVRGAHPDAGSSTRLFRSTRSTTFSTANARTHCTHFLRQRYSSNPHPNPKEFADNASWADVVLLFHTDQYNRVHHSEEVPSTFTMAPCVVVERL